MEARAWVERWGTMRKAKSGARTLLIILLTCGAGLRTVSLRLTVVERPIRSDAGEYVAYAINLVEHGTFSKDTGPSPRPDSFRSPGYPLFLAFVLRVAGRSWYPAIQWSQVLLSTLTLVSLIFLCRRFLPFWGVAVTLGLAAFSPQLVVLPVYILTETLLGFLLVTAAWLTLAAFQDFSRRIGLAAGLVWGLAYLVNETMLLGPMFVLAALLFRRRRSVRWGPAAALVLVFAVFPVLWITRNAISTDGELGASRAIATMSHGAYPGFVYEDSRYKYYAFREDPEQPEFSSSLSSFLKILGTRFAERPGRYLSWYLLEKPYHLWGFSYLQGTGAIFIYPVKRSLYAEKGVAATGMLMEWLHPVVVLLAMLALPLAISSRGRGRDGVVLCLSLHVLYTLVAVIFAPWPRYVVPIRPLTFATALWTAQAIPALWAQRCAAATTTGAAGTHSSA